MSIPVDPVSAVQEAMVDFLKQGFGWDDARRALREIEGMEFAFDKGIDKIVQISPPALYVVPMVWRNAGSLRMIEVQWTLYAVSAQARPQLRTGGSAAEMGVYGIAARTGALLDDWRPPVEGASVLRLMGSENLSGMTFVARKLSVMAVTLTGTVTVGLAEDAADLDDFLHYHSDWDLPPRTPAPASLPIDDPDFSNDVTLPGAGA